MVESKQLGSREFCKISNQIEEEMEHVQEVLGRLEQEFELHYNAKKTEIPGLQS